MQSHEKNKVVLVTGATGGIGRVVVQRLIQDRTTVLAVGHHVQRVETLCKEVSISDTACFPFTADMSDESQIQNLAETVQQQFPQIDWLVHAVGVIDEKEPQSDMSGKMLTSTFAVNTFSIMLLSELLSPIIMKGVIIISSTAGLWGNRDFPVYSASKGAVNTYGKSLARTFEERGLTSIVICPGPTNTPMRERIAGDATGQQRPEAIAEVITSVVREQSEYKNGDIVIVRDGTHKLHESL